MEGKGNQMKTLGPCRRLYGSLMRYLRSLKPSLFRPLMNTTSVEEEVGSQINTVVLPVASEEGAGTGPMKVPVERRASHEQANAGQKTEALGKMEEPVGRGMGVKQSSGIVAALSSEEEKDVGLKVLRPMKPVPRATSNINEKSLAFIKSKKEALKRTASDIQ